MAPDRPQALVLGLLVVGGVVLLGVAVPTIPAELGLTTVPGTTFAPTSDAADAYHVEWNYTIDRGGNETRVSRTLVRYPNGSWFGVEHGRFPTTRTTDHVRPVSREGAYRAPDERAYSLERYADPITVESVPAVVPDHVLVEGRVVYRRESPDSLPRYSGLVPNRLTYARVGTVTRDGERLVEYRVVGHDTAALPLLSSRYEGTLYATTDDVVRAYDITVADDGETTRLRYAATTTPEGPLPGWLETARTLPDPPPEDSPELRVIDGLDGVYALFVDEWRAPDDTAVGLLPHAASDGDEASAARLPPGALGEPIEGTDYRRIQLTRDGRFLTGAGPPAVDDPREAIVDHRGVNLLRVPVGRGDGLFDATVNVGRLRPAAGGGRTIRLDHVEPPTDGSLPVTLTVANRSTEIAVDVPANANEHDRWYLVRTTAGVELVPYDGIAPASLPTREAVAATRFPANASIRVAVAGIPVWRERVPGRLTNANERAIETSRTGVTVEAYANASDDDVIGDPPSDRSYDGYTLLYVHNWGYPDGVTVEGGVRSRPFTCPKDHTCYFRVSDGAHVEVRGDGIVLVDARVDGRATYAP